MRGAAKQSDGVDCTCRARGKEIIKRRQLLPRAVVGVEAIFDLAVPEKVERPAYGVADDVG